MNLFICDKKWLLRQLNFILAFYDALNIIMNIFKALDIFIGIVHISGGSRIWSRNQKCLNKMHNTYTL